MLVNLLSSANLGTYNIEMANLFGLQEAIYLQALIDINEKAVRKKMLDNDGYFVVDRDYIKSRTTFDNKSQKNLEANFIEFELLSVAKDCPDKIKINLNNLISLNAGSNEGLTDDIHKIINKKKNARTKKECIAENLKAHITPTHPDLDTAYRNWIDVLIAAKQQVNVDTVERAQILVNKFTNRNLDMALEIVKLASANTYRDMDWAIEQYEKSQNRGFTNNKYSGKINKNINITNSTVISSKPVELSDEVF